METKVYRLKEISDIKSGKRLPAGHDFSDSITEHPYVRARDIKKGVISSKDLAYISIDTYNKIKRYIIEKGDVAITIVANIGDVGYCDDKCHGANLTENAVRLTNFKKDIVDSKYLVKLLGQPFMKSYMESLAVGAAQAKLGIYKIEKIKIPLPSLVTQKKIASILSAYDSQIENNQKRIKLLKQMAENLYTEWFVRYRFPGYENAEFEAGRPKGWVSKAGENRKPKGWVYGELNQLGKFIRGKNITSAEMLEGQVPVISAGLEPSGYHNQSNVSGPCLTISSSGANAGYLKYNLTDIWAADCSYYNNLDNIWFVYSSLKYLQPVINNLQCGAAQPHVYPKDVNRLCVILPPKGLIAEYNKQCSLIFKAIHNLNNQISLHTHQRDLLLPRLMSGKLDVNV